MSHRRTPHTISFLTPFIKGQAWKNFCNPLDQHNGQQTRAMESRDRPQTKSPTPSYPRLEPWKQPPSLEICRGRHGSRCTACGLVVVVPVALTLAKPWPTCHGPQILPGVPCWRGEMGFLLARE